jgi:hypothetical protein
VTRHTDAYAPDPAPEAPRPPRPSRPAVVELAAAILIVGGVIGLFGALTAAPRLPAGAEPLLFLTIVLDVGAIVCGVLIRTGRAWVVAVNYVAVLAFLDLLAAASSPLALMIGVGNLAAVVIVLWHKSWFDAVGRWRAGDDADLTP